MWAWLLILLFFAAPSASADAPTDTVNRFPQPVRAGDLIGRKLLEPKESQPLLGHVEGVTRHADGSISMLIHTWSLLPWAGRTVEVPVGAVALLGERVALIGLTPAQFSALPEAGPERMPVPPDERIRIGLVRPFH